MKEFLPLIRAKRALETNMSDSKAEIMALIEKHGPCHRRILTDLSVFDTSSISHGIKGLIEDGFIQKLNNGDYALTPLGKDYSAQTQQVTSKYQTED